MLHINLYFPLIWLSIQLEKNGNGIHLHANLGIFSDTNNFKKRVMWCGAGGAVAMRR
jgi:hypothetical protein